MILVCAVDLRKISENVENDLLKKNHKKSFIGKNSEVWCFFKLARRIWNHPFFNSKKMHSSYFLQIFEFCIFGPQNCEVIETLSKQHFSPLKCTYSSKIHFNNISANSEKMK